MTDEVDQFLHDRAQEILSGERNGPRDRNDDRANGSSNRTGIVLAVEPDAEVQLLSDDGNVVANTNLVLPVDSRDVEVAKRRNPDYVRTTVIDGTDHRMITVHIEGGGAIQVARSLAEANSLLGVLRTRLLLIAGTMAALGAGVGWILARRTTGPLRSLSAAIEEVAETRDFTVPVEAGGSDEVGRLAEGFNRMLSALEMSREQQNRLVQDAAHELRTPLTSIKANVDWLSRIDGLTAEDRKAGMASVGRELGELNDLFNEIIELATDRHELPPFQMVDLAVVATTAVERARSRVDRPIELHAESTIVAGDADALRRAISNLLSNADKYSPPEAPILVHVGNGAVWVHDRGAGIPPDERAKVFDRFYRRQYDRSQPGSGLGLAIVASIVEAHRGRVGVGDSPGGGAKVGFELTARAAGR
ncbi:MAG: HAMP domain-containing histidine kinase [Actinomycetia bacterium]|nr:HAMP domain-containing histidine kinase [Actinomycetes bacterium]